MPRPRGLVRDCLIPMQMLTIDPYHTPRSAVDPRQYTRTASLLHWLLALALVSSLGVGLYMTSLPLSPLRLKLINWHKWAGICILLLSALRLLWRITHRPPPAAAGPAWQQLLSRGVHAAMYVLFFAVPLLGWAYSSAVGFPVVLFGLWPLPDWVAVDRELGAVLKPWHRGLAYALAALIVLHVVAALKHQWLDRDRLIGRMWPWGRASGIGAALWISIGFATSSPVSAQPNVAQPKSAQLVTTGSEIVFTTRQMGVPVEGRFGRFTAQVALDPKKPESGSVSFSIDTGSARFGAPELDGEVPKPIWLNVAKFPQATFQSSGIKAAGAARFEVSGKLFIKGRARDIVVPVQLAASGANSVASGSFVLQRLDFKVGEADWADTSLLANEVNVKFKLVLSGLAPQ